MNLDKLRRRAELLDRLRAFFKERGFLEVETPLAAREAIPEQHIQLYQIQKDERWLQASPEMHHKRLLCAESGAIFEVTRSFRGCEWGKHHNPEFALLEWYRPGDTMSAAIELTESLLSELLGAPRAIRTSYREAFARVLDIDPHSVSDERLRSRCKKFGRTNVDGLPEVGFEFDSLQRDDLLNFLLSLHVEPTLGHAAPEFLYYYPASQSALAATVTDGHGTEVAERFELYWQGLELANGYYELTDPVELRKRLELVNVQRAQQGWPVLPMPEKLLSAMTDPGLPACAGVAVGFDRLVMLATGAKNIGEVVAFSEFY